MDQTVLSAMTERLEQGKLACGQAFVVARNLDVAPSAVGRVANDADIHISHCQLGLFGYGPKAEGKHKIVHPMDAVPDLLASRLQAEAEGGAITCQALWQIAAEAGISRLESAAAVETLGLRVSVCQLGCFPRPVKG